eukprot:COSAG02_NODE_60526_length_271_cov_0.598837_1_plen_81_part_10
MTTWLWALLGCEFTNHKHGWKVSLLVDSIYRLRSTDLPYLAAQLPVNTVRHQCIETVRVSVTLESGYTETLRIPGQTEKIL